MFGLFLGRVCEQTTGIWFDLVCHKLLLLVS
jgi:hypothetical protein